MGLDWRNIKLLVHSKFQEMLMIKRFADTRTNGVRVRLSFVFKLVFAVLACLFLTQTAYAGGFALSGVGSKAIGMGGAFRGLADDWSAAYWNPAGLTQIENSELNAMLIGITPRPEYTPNITYGTLDVGYRNGDKLYTNDKTHFGADFSGFMKIKGLNGVTAGIAVFVPYGLGSEWDLFDPTGMDLANSFPYYDHKTDLRVIDFHPTIARAFGNLSLGVGLSVLRGSVTFQKTYLRPSGIPAPHENFIIDSEMEGTGYGVGANFGLLYKLSDKLQFGVSGKTASTIKLEGTTKQTLYTLNNELLRNYLLQNSATAAESTQVFLLFSTDNHVGEPDAKADFKTPADVGFGLAFKPTNKLTLSGEVAYTLWSSLDSILIELDGVGPDGQPAENSAIILDWENTLRFSIGAEYWIKEPLAIRLGYYMDPSPVNDDTFTPLIPDIGDKNSFNVGAAVKSSGIEISYNFEYIKFKDRTVTTLEDVNDDGYYDNYPGTYKANLYASHLSVTYRF